MGSAIPDGTSEVTEPIPSHDLYLRPKPEPESGVNIEVPTAHLTITTFPAKIEIKGAVERRFSESPQAVINDAKDALAITIVLQDVLRQERSNSPEAGEAQTLLEQQCTILSNVIEALQSGSNEEAARESTLDLLNDLMASILRNWAHKGPVRGTLAVAALTVASVLGLELDWATQLLIAGSFVGEGVIEKLKGWRGKD